MVAYCGFIAEVCFSLDIEKKGQVAMPHTGGQQCWRLDLLHALCASALLLQTAANKLPSDKSWFSGSLSVWSSVFLIGFIPNSDVCVFGFLDCILA